MKTLVWNIDCTPFTNDGVFGPLLIDGTEVMQMFGLPYRDNAKGVSRLPNGIYLLIPHISPHFGFCYKVMWEERDGKLSEPDGRTDVLIHPGNTVADIEGCMCPGLELKRFDYPMKKSAVDRLTAQSCCDKLPLDMELVKKNGLWGLTLSQVYFKKLRDILGDTETHKFIIAENIGCGTHY